MGFGPPRGVRGAGADPAGGQGRALEPHPPPPPPNAVPYFFFITAKAATAPTTTASPTTGTSMPPPDAFSFPVPAEVLGASAGAAGLFAGCGLGDGDGVAPLAGGAGVAAGVYDLSCELGVCAAEPGVLAGVAGASETGLLGVGVPPTTLTMRSLISSDRSSRPESHLTAHVVPLS